MEMPSDYSNSQETKQRIRIWDVITSGDGDIEVQTHNRSCDGKDFEQELIHFMASAKNDFWIASGEWSIEDFTFDVKPKWLSDGVYDNPDRVSTKFHHLSLTDLMKTYLWIRAGHRVYEFSDKANKLIEDCILGVLGQFVWNCNHATMKGDVLDVLADPAFGELTEDLVVQKAQDMVNEKWRKEDE